MAKKSSVISKGSSKKMYSLSRQQMNFCHYSRMEIWAPSTSPKSQEFLPPNTGKRGCYNDLTSQKFEKHKLLPSPEENVLPSTQKLDFLPEQP